MDTATTLTFLSAGVVMPTIQWLNTAAPWLSKVAILKFALVFGMTGGLVYLASFTDAVPMVFGGAEHIQTAKDMTLAAIGLKAGYKTYQNTRKLPGEKK